MCLHKIYNIHLRDADHVYIGTDIKAGSKDEAIALMYVVAGGHISTDAEIISCSTAWVH
jgi:hypothetical protein|tara:strand:- start:191 stop:367 length:177 start_codon:yes stop_codon:yes gene_type:complete